MGKLAVRLSPLLAVALFVAACGDSTGPAAARNDPGTGTRTLKVIADIKGQDVSGGS